MSGYATLWLEAFGLTLLIETPIYAWLLGRLGMRVSLALALSLGLQLATHPLVWFVAPALPLYHDSYEAWLIVVEAAVVVAEGLLVGAALATAGRPRHALRLGLAISLAANAVSTAVGLLIS